jgi:hypothetical protein
MILHGTIANAFNCKCDYNELSTNIVIIIVISICVCGTTWMKAKWKINYYKLHLITFNKNNLIVFVTCNMCLQLHIVNKPNVVSYFWTNVATTNPNDNLINR